MGSSVGGRVTNVTQSFGGVLATAGGAVGGIMAQDHHGAPVWLFLLAIAGSLLFGLISSSFRPEQADERLKLIRQNIVNSGALWVLSCGVVWTMNLHFSTSMVVALVFGLFGTQVLSHLEEKFSTKSFLESFLKWALDRVTR